jgi:transcriptional regulator with XRE-family HTH domain
MPRAISNQRISVWEHGKERPTNDNLEALAEILDTTVRWLEHGEHQAPDGPEPVWVARLENQVPTIDRSGTSTGRKP